MSANRWIHELYADMLEPEHALEQSWFELRSGEQMQITTEPLDGRIVDGLIPVKTYGEIAVAYASRPGVRYAARTGGPCPSQQGGHPRTSTSRAHSPRAPRGKATTSTSAERDRTPQTRS